ncbi:hypothetical protein X896_775 [Burkholderia pseudomallei ABCPW 1]|nr:hypothetical protein X896_775 [Burkholderia pseudomallei ABCPW 1]
MKVRHLKRRFPSWGMRRMVSTYLLKRYPMTPRQRKILRYRDYWK